MRQDAGYSEPFFTPANQKVDDGWYLRQMTTYDNGLYAEEEPEDEGRLSREVRQDADDDGQIPVQSVDAEKSAFAVVEGDPSAGTVAQGGAGAVPEALSPSERRNLELLEVVIAEWIQEYIKVGQALESINTQLLYRETHKTFADYVQERWGWSVRNAYHYMKASQTAENVKLISHHGTIPFTHALELSRAPEDLQGALWEEAVHQSHGEPPTVAVVRQIVKANAPREKTESERWSEEQTRLANARNGVSEPQRERKPVPEERRLLPPALIENLSYWPINKTLAFDVRITWPNKVYRLTLSYAEVMQAITEERADGE